MVKLGLETGKTPGQLIHDTHAPFDAYEHVIDGRITQESDLGYAIKKLYGVDLTPTPFLNSGAPHEYVELDKYPDACRVKQGPKACRGESRSNKAGSRAIANSDSSLFAELPSDTDALKATIAWHISKRVLRDRALGDWDDVKGPFEAMLDCVESGKRIWSGKPAREGYKCADDD